MPVAKRLLELLRIRHVNRSCHYFDHSEMCSWLHFLCYVPALCVHVYTAQIGYSGDSPQRGFGLLFIGSEGKKHMSIAVKQDIYFHPPPPSCKSPETRLLLSEVLPNDVAAATVATSRPAGKCSRAHSQHFYIIRGGT